MTPDFESLLRVNLTKSNVRISIQMNVMHFKIEITNLRQNHCLVNFFQKHFVKSSYSKAVGNLSERALLIIRL